MKLTTAIAILSIAPTSEAIYLVCCQSTQSCPEQYNTIDTLVKGEDTFNACCYPDEEANVNDLPECVHPIMSENGEVGISLMMLPQTKLETENATTSQLLEEITITEGNEEITIELTSIAEPANTEESDDAPYECCAVASTVKPALRLTQGEVQECPGNMHAVGGLTLNLESLEGAKTNTFVCCDSETLANDVDTALVKPCSSEVMSEESEEESTTNDEQKGEDDKTEEANTAALSTEGDESSSASTVSTVAFGVAALCAMVQSLV
eukprot:scaffold4911_cov47-Cyclotella_meneghiniana.AAC.11